MSKTNELLGKLGRQMRDFPQISTFAGAKQAENAINQAKPAKEDHVTSEISPAREDAGEEIMPVAKTEKQAIQEGRGKKPKAGAKSVRNFSVTLHQSDIETMQEIRFLIMKEAGKPTVSVSETLRIALRAFRSSKPLSEIIQEVEELDGRGMWRNK